VPRAGGWRRNQGDELPARILVVPETMDGRTTPSWAENDVDLVIHCSLPPMLDPSATWLGQTPQRAILVATRGLTRFGQAQQTAEMLERVGVRVVAAILLPYRFRPAPKAPV